MGRKKEKEMKKGLSDKQDGDGEDENASRIRSLRKRKTEAGNQGQAAAKKNKKDFLGKGQGQGQSKHGSGSGQIHIFPSEGIQDGATSSSYLLRSRNVSKGQDKGQGSEVKEEGPITNLPPEMLAEILKCVDTRSLFACRLVNRLWWEISSGILTTRSDDDALLTFKHNAKGQKLALFSFPERKLSGISLKDFVKCIKKSKSRNVPFARFSFDVYSTSFFDRKDWIEFLAFFAPSNSNPNLNPRTKIKYLNLNFYQIGPERFDLDFLVEKLRDLLLTKIPYLEEFKMSVICKDNTKNMKLFSPLKTTQVNAHPFEAQLAVPVPAQLPNLKVLHLNHNIISDFPGIVEDLLNAAVNLSSIRMPIEHLEDLYFLQSLKKLHLLRKATIEIEQQFEFANVI